MNVQAAYFAASKAYQKGQYVPALEQLNRLLDVSGDAKNYVLLAKTLIKLSMPAVAAAAYQKAAEVGERRADEYLLRAMQLYVEAGEEDNALLTAKKLVHKAHEDAEIAFILASIFLKRGQSEVIKGLRKPLVDSKDPRHVALATLLITEDPHDEENYRAIAVATKKLPKHHYLRFRHQQLLFKISDFDAVRRHQSFIAAQVKARGEQVLAHERPFGSLRWCADERWNRLATHGAPTLTPAVTRQRREMDHKWNDRKIRVGYLSSDFWSQHATMKLLGDVLRRHDRGRFEIYLFCHTSREHLERNDVNRALWGEVVRVVDMSDGDAAAAIREREIDILVDLKGHTRDTRCKILNQAVAPVQVAWLGFPGSTLGIDLDYVIGDRFVLPESSRPFYHEKFCRLPDTYQPNDPSSRPYPQPMTRGQVGLPQDAFVFASFNTPQKVLAETVALWARILQRAPNSVLWLMTTSEKSRVNLLDEFALHGVDAGRIIFAGKIAYDQHISRQNCADLGLDTFPYNGHTTTSDSLWGGLPILTRKGTNFASRVSESLLNAIGLPELVAADADDYVDKAVELYENRQRIAEYKERIEEARLLHPLFDSERFCRHLEKAYEMMVDRAKTGQAPDHFDVPALPPRELPFSVAQPWERVLSVVAS